MHGNTPECIATLRSMHKKGRAVPGTVRPRGLTYALASLCVCVCVCVCLCDCVRVHTLQNAYKCYVRVRDYCTAPRHILAMCLSVIRVNVELGNYWNVANYVAKAENTAEYQVNGRLHTDTRTRRTCGNEDMHVFVDDPLRALAKHALW